MHNTTDTTTMAVMALEPTPTRMVKTAVLVNSSAGMKDGEGDAENDGEEEKEVEGDSDAERDGDMDEELEDEVVDRLIAESVPASSCSSLFFEFFIASISGRFRERISFLLAILFAP